MKFDWNQCLRDLAVLFVLAGMAILLMGCSWSSQTRSQSNDRVRAQGSVAGVPVDLVVDRQGETQEQTAGETRVPALSAMASAAAQGSAFGGPVGGILGLIAGAASAWMATKGTVKTLKDQIEYHKRDAEEGWQKADERALKLPPA